MANSRLSMYKDPLEDRDPRSEPSREETQPLISSQAKGNKGKYKARVENLKGALRKWVTINEQRSMALQNSADNSERIKETSIVQKRLMKQMDGQINDLSDKVSTAEDLVKKQSEALDKAEGIGGATGFGIFVVVCLVTAGIYVAIKYNIISV